MKKRTSLSRKITTSELRIHNGDCYTYSAEEIKELNRKLVIQENLKKLLLMKEVSASNKTDYSPIPTKEIA